MARRRPLGWTMLLVPVMAVVEVIVIILVAHAIGAWQTFGLLVLFSFVGALLVKSQWRTAWSGLRTALQTGRAPAKELTDAALVLIGGALLVVPGFVGDIIGLLLLLPFTRPLARPLLQAAVARRLLAGSTFVSHTYVVGETYPEDDGVASTDTGPSSNTSSNTPPADHLIEGEVIEGKIVDDE